MTAMITFTILLDRSDAPSGDTALLRCPFCGRGDIPVPDGMTYRNGATDPSGWEVIQEHNPDLHSDDATDVCVNRLWSIAPYQVRDAKSGELLDSGTYEVPVYHVR